MNHTEWPKQLVCWRSERWPCFTVQDVYNKPIYTVCNAYFLYGHCGHLTIFFNCFLLPQVPANRKEIIPRVDRAIRLALLRRGGIPSSFTSHAVRDGALSLAVEGEFEVRNTM